MEYFLHIDTSAETCTVALSADGIPRAHQLNTDTRSQAANINRMIAEVLAEEGIALSRLSGVAVCAGPGSYTGLRVSMATAKAICYVNNIPLFAQNKLTLMAHQAINQYPEYESYIAVLIAREQEYFVAAYNRDLTEQVAPVHMPEADLPEMLNGDKNILIIGNIHQETVNSLAGSEIRILPVEILDLESWSKFTYNQFKCNESVNLASAEPFYLKQVYTHNSKKNK